tara:strand:- start:12128 stop:12928 length:801 start_codon:yes stop_codon:yes gene_type:complete
MIIKLKKKLKLSINKKITTGVILFILGVIGILSLLTMNVYLPEVILEEIREQFSLEQLKLLLLINPSISLIVATIVGFVLYDKTCLKVPMIEKITGRNEEKLNILDILKFGIIGGVLAGIVLVLMELIFKANLSKEFLESKEQFRPTLAVKLLYGGLTEEIVFRFGLMTFFVWVLSQLIKSTKPYVLWLSIIISAVIFALSHLPIALMALPSSSSNLLTYIVLANSVGGVVFGWLYWKKGLESAFIAHAFAHIFAHFGVFFFFSSI